MSERLQYRFSLKKEPTNMALINFLRQDDETGARDKLLSALFSYWLPFALKADGNHSELELKQYARYAIYKLKLHIAYLGEEFFLDDVSVCPPIIPVQQVKYSTPVSEPVSDLVNENLIESETPYLNTDILSDEYDGVLETMFGQITQNNQLPISE